MFSFKYYIQQFSFIILNSINQMFIEYLYVILIFLDTFLIWRMAKTFIKIAKIVSFMTHLFATIYSPKKFLR